MRPPCRFRASVIARLTKGALFRQAVGMSLKLLCAGSIAISLLLSSCAKQPAGADAEEISGLKTEMISLKGEISALRRELSNGNNALQKLILNLEEMKKEMAAVTEFATPPPATANAPGSKPVKEDLPYGIRVPGKPKMVYSPYAPDKGEVDVAGINPNLKVKCPYTGKSFRVP